MKGRDIAVVYGNEKVITNAQSALDIAITAKYEADIYKTAIDKNAAAKDFFFRLSAGAAGEILQKFINRLREGRGLGRFCPMPKQAV